MFKKSSRITVTVIMSVFLLFIALLTGSCRNPASQRNIIVSFDTAGGTPIIECQIIHPGERIEPVADPTRAGFRFAGWYQDPPYYTTNWDFYDCFAWRNKTLHARWTRAGGGGGSGGGGSGTPPSGQQFTVTVNSVSTGMRPSFTAGPLFMDAAYASTLTATPATFITAAPGDLVTVTASRPDPDVTLPLACTYEFGKWRIPNNVTFTDSLMHTMKTATFIMPAANVTIEAVFVDGSIFHTGPSFTLPSPVYSIWHLYFCTISGWFITPPPDLIIPGSIAGNSIQGIEWLAFDSKGLTSVSIPYSVTQISGGAFHFNNLTSVTIPADVSYIGDFVFAFNPNLNEITIFGNPTIYDFFLFDSPTGNISGGWTCTFWDNYGPTTPAGRFVWNAGNLEWELVEPF